jgi:hypothetical protein
MPRTSENSGRALAAAMYRCPQVSRGLNMVLRRSFAGFIHDASAPWFRYVTLSAGRGVHHMLLPLVCRAFSSKIHDQEVGNGTGTFKGLRQTLRCS